MQNLHITYFTSEHISIMVIIKSKTKNHDIIMFYFKFIFINFFLNLTCKYLLDRFQF